MKKVITLAVVSAVALGLVAAARAQGVSAVKCHVSFTFYAGDREMPAGDYTFEQQAQGVLIVRGEAGKAAAMVMARDYELSSAATTSSVVFKRYADHYFLAQVVRQGQQTGTEIQPTRTQLKFARAETPTTVPVSGK